MGILYKKNSEGKKEPTSFANGLAKTFATTSKQLLWFYSINGVLWIWCSYILAFMDRVQIAEALSSDVCKIVLGQIGFYLISKTIENIFKYNDIFKSRKKENETTNENNEEVNYDVDIQIPVPQPVEFSGSSSDESVSEDDESVG